MKGERKHFSQSFPLLMSLTSSDKLPFCRFLDYPSFWSDAAILIDACASVRVQNYIVVGRVFSVDMSTRSANVTPLFFIEERTLTNSTRSR